MKRHWVSTLIAILFLVLVVTGVMGFFLPFSLLTVSVHSFAGFLFVAAIAFHVRNNYRPLRKYLTQRSAVVVLLLVAGYVAVVLWRPAPVDYLLSLSSNTGPEAVPAEPASRFEAEGQRMTFRYDPAPHYRMQLEVIGGPAYEADPLPFVAIWVENRSGYHIQTLHHSEAEGYEQALAYWHFQREQYLLHKERAEQMTEEERQAELDALSSATENDSFDPADYIVPDDPEREAPYRVLIEINQRGDANEHYDDQPSLVYSVQVDNADPRTLQVLEIVGYPKAEALEDGDVEWSLYYADQTITTARDLLDSALLRIERDRDGAGR